MCVVTHHPDAAAVLVMLPGDVMMSTLKRTRAEAAEVTMLPRCGLLVSEIAR